MADRMTDRILGDITPKATIPPEWMEDLAKECRMRVSASEAGTASFREQRREDMKFVEFQYDDEDVEEREQARKPALQTHLVKERIQEAMHRYRESGLWFRVGSATGETGNDAAKAFNGLAQRDQRESLGEAEMERIVNDAAYYGEGWGTWDEVDAEGLLQSGLARYDESGGGRIEYADTAEASVFDRRLRLRHCDAEHIYEDPSDTSPDRREMAYLIETEMITLEERNARWPKAKRLPASVFSAGDGWFTNDPDEGHGPKRDQRVVIARYFRRRVETVTYVWHPGEPFKFGAVREDRLTQEQQAVVQLDPMNVRRVTKSSKIVELIVTDGLFVLEGPTTLPYETIPYFRAVHLEEKLPNGEITKRGMVYLLRDPNAAISVGLSDIFWKTAIASPPVWLATGDSTLAYPRDWEDTTRPLGIRRYDEYSRYPGSDGNPLKLTPPQFVSPTPDLSGALQMLEVTRNFMSASAGAADPNQRETNVQQRSGVAMDRLERMRAAAQSLLTWNAEHIAIPRSGSIWVMKARYIYDRVGRHLIVAGESPSKPDEGWLVGVPFVRHPTTGELVPVQVPKDARTFPLPGSEDMTGQPRTLQVHRFNPGTDAVRVVTHAQSLNAAGNDVFAENLGVMAGALGQGNPAQLVLLKGALHAIGDRFPVDDVLKGIEALSPPAADQSQTDLLALPGQLRAQQQQMAQMQEAMQQLQQQADQNNAAKEIAQLRGQIDLMKAQMDSQTKVAIEDRKIDADREKTAKTLEQKEDAAVLAAATKLDSDETAAEVVAFTEGLKAGIADGQQQDGQGGGNKSGGDKPPRRTKSSRARRANRGKKR